MTKIFFFSPSGYLPMKDENLKAMCRTHGWQPDGAGWVYGVAIPYPQVDPNEVADMLTVLGVTVLPGVHDTAAPQGSVIAALAKQGIIAGDNTLGIARKMHAASGMPALRPHLF